MFLFITTQYGYISYNHFHYEDLYTYFNQQNLHI